MASSRKRRWDNKTEVREEALSRLALQENAFDNDMMKRMNNNAPVNNNVVAPNNVVNNNNSTNVLPKMENVNTHRTIMSVNDDAVF